MADNVLWRKGTIVSFNQVTGANSVNIGGTVVPNVPILGVAEAATYVPDAEVGILIADSGGSQSPFIMGRIVRPNTSAYTDAVNLLSNSIQTASVSTGESTNATVHGNLTTLGPMVQASVKSSGRLIVMMSATILAVDDAAPVRGGSMGVEVRDSSGAVIFMPASLPELNMEYQDNATHTIGDVMAATRVILLENLSADTYTITAKYRAGASANSAQFSGRNITTISL